MPRAQKGERFGGRVKGVPNKATIERQLIAARALDAARAQARPLAKERLDELLGVALGAMTAHQPVSEEMVEKARAAGQVTKARAGNWETFGEWFDRAVYAAKELAKYQSPTFKAIAVATPVPVQQEHQAVPNNVHQINDPNAASRVYLQVVKSGKAA